MSQQRLALHVGTYTNVHTWIRHFLRCCSNFSRINRISRRHLRPLLPQSREIRDFFFGEKIYPPRKSTELMPQNLPLFKGSRYLFLNIILGPSMLVFRRVVFQRSGALQLRKNTNHESKKSKPWVLWLAIIFGGHHILWHLAMTTSRW